MNIILSKGDEYRVNLLTCVAQKTDDIKNAELIGISEIIIKPVIAAELSDRISNVLNNTKQKNAG